jgi:hypothetical protein
LQTSQAQCDTVCAWGIPNHSLLQRLAAVDLPVFVANGDSDPMILPRYSHLLAGLLQNARLIIYPDSAHGFLFQHHRQFAADVNAFLTVRTWLAETAAHRLRLEAGRHAIAAWERQHGPFAAAELAGGLAHARALLRRPSATGRTA